MPHIVIKTDFIGPDGQEEQLAEYMCDIPGCPNVATCVLGYARDLGAARVVCPIHASGSFAKK